MAAFDDYLNESLKKLGYFDKGVEDVTDSLKKVTAPLEGLKGIFEQVGNILASALQPRLTAVADTLIAYHESVRNLNNEMKRQQDEARRGASGGVGNASAALGGFAAGAIGGAIGSLLGPLQAVTSAVGPFVAALNPSLMQLFNFNLRNLMATIGVGLQPVIQVLSLTLKQLAITLFPAMQALAPIMGNLANILIGNLIPYIGIFADLFVALAPVIEFVTDLMATMAETSRVITTVMRTLIQTILQFIGSLFDVDLKSISQQFQDVMQTVVKYLVTFAAYLAKFLNSIGIQNNFVDNLIRNFSALQGQGQQALAAPSGASSKSFEQIGSDIAKAAFVAQGGGAAKQKDQLDFLKDLTESLKDIQQNNKTLRDWLDELLKDVFNTSVDKILVGLASLLPDPPTLDDVKQKANEIIRDNPKTANIASMGLLNQNVLNLFGL